MHLSRKYSYLISTFLSLVSFSQDYEEQDLRELFKRTGVVKRIAFDYIMPDTTRIYRRFVTNSEGLETERAIYSQDGKNVKELTQMKYDAANQLVSEIKTDSTGKLIRKLEFTYGPKGTVKTVTETNSKGTVTKRDRSKENVFDSRGNIIKSIGEDGVYESVYDEKNRRIMAFHKNDTSRFFYDDQDRLIRTESTGPWGKEYSRIVYNANGKRIINVEKRARKVLDDRSAYVYDSSFINYNDKGNFISSETFDKNKKLKSARYLFYNSTGLKIYSESKMYDENNPVPFSSNKTLCDVLGRDSIKFSEQYGSKITTLFFYDKKGNLLRWQNLSDDKKYNYLVKYHYIYAGDRKKQ
jgi:hypothetical protein